MMRWGGCLTFEGGKGRAGGKDGPALRVEVGRLGRALGLAGWVGQREDDRRLVQARHLLKMD